jgi:hypothetical protein
MDEHGPGEVLARFSYEELTKKMAEIKALAHRAAARGDWPQNHEYCARHDDLALERERRRRAK